MDSKYNIKEEMIKYINGQKCDHYECGLEEQHDKINIVLFWNFKYFTQSQDGIDTLIAIRSRTSHKVVFIGYNWDPIPPLNDSLVNVNVNVNHSNSLKLKFIQLMNGYLTCDGREIKILDDMGVYNYLYCPPGFDSSITHYIDDPSYHSDVSIVCTNLYTDYNIFPRQSVRVHRKELVDLIYQHRNEIVFHIYGPPNLGQMYPDCYKGYISYQDCPKVFSNSKINLCIHATSYNNYRDYLYFSERLPQIMGAHGLVYCETEYTGLLQPNVNYILSDSNDPWLQIKEILHMYQSPKIQQIKKNGYETATKYLTWDNMVKKIQIITRYLL
ncbi:MAG: hypothetical protein ABIN35_00075 [candidate division WOR-3 bacterium]